MYLKIENRLNDSDYAKLSEALDNGSFDTITLLQRLSFESVQVTELAVYTREKGYSIATYIFPRDPIEITSCVNERFEESPLEKSPTHLKLNIERAEVNLKELKADVEYSLSLIEKVANLACKMRGEHISDVLSVDSSAIDQQLAKAVSERDRQRRGEKIEPFAIIHADSGFDLNTSSDDLVPIYQEYDRWDLFGGKKAYRLLPRDFARKLLRCQGSDMIPESQFAEKEREVLRDLARKRLIKRKEIAGEAYYFDLNTKTITYLNKALRKKSF